MDGELAGDGKQLRQFYSVKSKLTGDNIYKVLIYFEKLYAVMNEVERRQFMETLISEIQIYGDRQSNGQWPKFI